MTPTDRPALVHGASSTGAPSPGAIEEVVVP
jgi:hypothetical protein